jgi:hypothetical protein
MGKTIIVASTKQISPIGRLANHAARGRTTRSQRRNVGSLRSIIAG